MVSNLENSTDVQKATQSFISAVKRAAHKLSVNRAQMLSTYQFGLIPPPVFSLLRGLPGVNSLSAGETYYREIAL